MHTLNGIKYSLPVSIRIPGEIRILPLQVVRVLVWLAGPTVKEATPETGEHIFGSQLNSKIDSKRIQKKWSWPNQFGKMSFYRPGNRIY